MPQRVEYNGVVHEFPDDFTPQEISDALSAADSTAAPAAPATRPFSFRNVAKPYLDALPMVGGGIGGAAGILAAGGPTMGLAAAPGGLMGAGIGGAAGEWLRELGYAAIGEKVPSPASWEGSPEALKALGRMSGAGTEQMLYQGAGELPAAGARLLAKPLAKGAVRPTAKMLQEFADLNLPQEMIDRGIGTPQAATEARRASAGEARRMLANATRAKTTAASGQPSRQFTYAAEQFVNSPQVARLRRELANSSLPTEAKAELESFFEAWKAQHANRTSPIKWYKLAQSLQREARPFYGRGAQGVGQQIASSPNVQAAKAALATAIKEGLGNDIKGLRAQDANTRVLIALERALTRSNRLMLSGRTLLPAFLGDVAARSMGHSGLAEIPAALTAAYVGHAATSPAVLGRTAVAVTQPGFQQAARQFPRLLEPILPPLVGAERDATSR